jgi:hypothetical protein
LSIFKVRDFDSMRVRGFCSFLMWTALYLMPSWNSLAETKAQVPEFGRNTVLVWEIPREDSSRTFVARLAGFYPDLLLEWEDSRSQGTVFISNRDILEAKEYTNRKLFKPGMDVRSKDETTLWLSRKIYSELKEKKQAKCRIDGIPGRMTYEGDGEITVDVNGSPMALPVIKVRDDRGSEKWFLDRPENPLMVKYTMRQYTQVLASISTNRGNTLRWIKGPKLKRMLPGQ